MIITLLAGFFFAYYFVNVAKIVYLIKKIWDIPYHERIKPFDCVTCLSVWTSAVLYFLPVQFSQFILVIFAAGFLGQKIK